MSINFPKTSQWFSLPSEADETVPMESTLALVDALVKKGKNDIYLLKLKKSSHPNYMYDNDDDRKTYEDFMNPLINAMAFLRCDIS